MNDEELNDAIYELGVLITDPSEGLIIKTMKQDFYEKFKRFELIEAWECVVDEVNRVDTVIKLYDELVRRENGDYDMNLLKEFMLFYKESEGYENISELKESEWDLINLFLGEKI